MVIFSKAAMSLTAKSRSTVVVHSEIMTFDKSWQTITPQIHTCPCYIRVRHSSPINLTIRDQPGFPGLVTYVHHIAGSIPTPSFLNPSTFLLLYMWIKTSAKQHFVHKISENWSIMIRNWLQILYFSPFISILAIRTPATPVHMYAQGHT